MRNDIHKPAIRFQGFTDAWEQRKYSDVIDLLSGQDFAPSDYNDEGLGMPYMTGASCIQNGQTMEMRWTPIPKCIVEKGDVLLVCKGSGYGTLARLTQEKAHIARQFMALKCKTDLNNTFNYYLAESVANSIKVDARGLIAGIDRSAVLRQDVVLPKIEEQQKIGVFFNNLDNLITLHQRKYEKLLTVKKSMLEKMFPRDGSNNPEIRFIGFTDPWEQRKLGDISDSYSGGTPTVGKTEYYGGDIPFIRSAEINSDSTELFLTTEGLNNSSAKMVKKGDILYALYGATSGETGLAQIDGAINQAILDIKPHEGYVASFIMYWLRKSKKNIIGTYLQGGQGNLSGNIVTSLMIDCPNYEEQKKIGKLLMSLDNLITLHHLKLEKLKNIKQSLLQNMFV